MADLTFTWEELQEHSDKGTLDQALEDVIQAENPRVVIEGSVPSASECVGLFMGIANRLGPSVLYTLKTSGRVYEGIKRRTGPLMDILTVTLEETAVEQLPSERLVPYSPPEIVPIPYTPGQPIRVTAKEIESPLFKDRLPQDIGGDVEIYIEGRPDKDAVVMLAHCLILRDDVQAITMHTSQADYMSKALTTIGLDLDRYNITLHEYAPNQSQPR